jgi:hypothetical protein
MSKYADVRAGCANSKYARGGRVGKDKRGRTVINIVVPPSAGGMPAAGPVPAPAAPAPSGAAGAPMPPPAAAMALNQMQGKPGAPGMFANGGRVKAGAESGVGRLEAAHRAKAKRK